MVSRIRTVAFSGIEVLPVDVQVQIAGGLPAFTLVGLPDKAVGESRERVRAALGALGLALPPKRITVNLAPADLLKEGSHFDLPIALGLLLAMGVLPVEELERFVALGELALDGQITAVAGVLPAAIAANAEGRGLICPAKTGGEAAWSGGEVLAPGPKERLVQFIDVRDLARFTLDMVEKKAGGTYNATGPAERMSMGEMLDQIAKTIGSTAKLTWVEPEFLVEGGVTPYTEMPLSLPKSEKRPLFASISNAKGIAAGLRHRPFAETVRDTLAWWKGEKTPPAGAALKREKESDLLAKWKAKGA